MLKLTKELAQKCLDNHLQIIHIDKDVTEWGPLDLNAVTASDDNNFDIDLITYDLNDSSQPKLTQYVVKDTNTDKDLMTPGTPDDVIAFIETYQPKTTEA